MKLLLHMFRKDVRHFYPEILVNVALLILFAWIAPLARHPLHPGMDNIVMNLVALLLPLGWLVTISRVLHDEVLVGDRQYWITRPYSWPMLLAEKMSFRILFVQVPVFLMQCYLLHNADLPIAPALGRLLEYQGFLAAVYVLPFTAVTAVTASFGRQLLSVLGGVVYLVAVGALTAWLTHKRMAPPYMDRVAAVIVVGTVMAVIVAMYARRPVMKSRIALLCLPVVFAMLMCVPNRALVQRAYASPASGDALLFDNNPSHQAPGTGEPREFDHEVALEVPVQLHMESKDQEATIHGAQVTLLGADGTSWTSPFQGTVIWLHSDIPGSVRMQVPVAVYQRLESQPVKLELQAAVERFAFPPAQTLTVLADSRVALPNGGVCVPDPVMASLECRYALRSPPPVAAALELQGAPCDQNDQKQTIHRRTDGSLSGLRPSFDPVSVQYIRLDLRSAKGTEDTTEAQLCPGARASFATEQMIGRERLSLTVPSVSLPLYVEHRRGTASR